MYLGLGIQSNQARLLRTGGFYPDHGLERIVAYHERQDERFARAAAEISDATGKPILTATELAVAFPDNPGPATVRATGRGRSDRGAWPSARAGPGAERTSSSPNASPSTLRSCRS